MKLLQVEYIGRIIYVKYFITYYIIYKFTIGQNHKYSENR
jgi:hypothetical protein